MLLLTLRACRELILFDLLSVFGGFPTIRKWLARTSIDSRKHGSPTIQEIVEAVDVVGTFYWHQIRCLQRSFAGARLARQSGIGAELVIGTRPVPFLSHAWIEVNGDIVNDYKGYKRKLFVIERIGAEAI